MADGEGERQWEAGEKKNGADVIGSEGSRGGGPRWWTASRTSGQLAGRIERIALRRPLVTWRMVDWRRNGRFPTAWGPSPKGWLEPMHGRNTQRRWPRTAAGSPVPTSRIVFKYKEYYGVPKKGAPGGWGSGP